MLSCPDVLTNVQISANPDLFEARCSVAWELLEPSFFGLPSLTAEEGLELATAVAVLFSVAFVWRQLRRVV